MPAFSSKTATSPASPPASPVGVDPRTAFANALAPAGVDLVEPLAVGW